jgi:potassium efflux system protein
MGIGWSSVQWLVAAMTVGLGFGLQEIFANFVSGIIILFERPVRVGDIVTVGGGTGTVTQIRMRATTITDSDRKEFIVPNKKFITDEVINWTLSDPITRVVIRVGIAYGSDIQLAHRLLLRAAKKHPLVVDEPEPTALFAGFGPSTLDFELRAFIPNRDAHATVLHDLNTAIDRSFRDAKIELAFPQQDLHIRSLPPGFVQQHEIKPATEAA